MWVILVQGAGLHLEVLVWDEEEARSRAEDASVENPGREVWLFKWVATCVQVEAPRWTESE